MGAAAVTQAALLAAIRRQAPADVSQAAMLVAYKGSPLAAARVSQEALLVSFANTSAARVTQSAMMVAYSKGISGIERTRAWTFNFDGHSFYVLSLGEEGTFVYDDLSNTWSQFDTGAIGAWNMIRGRVWQQRVIGADLLYPYVWMMDPTSFLDEGWRDIEHKVSGEMPWRSRQAIPVGQFRIAGSVGYIGDTASSVKLRWSDDGGATFTAYYEFDLTLGNYSQDIAFLSLGSMQAPGRVYELYDLGGLTRIDGVDIQPDLPGDKGG